jgi:hypothetical protein
MGFRSQFIRSIFRHRGGPQSAASRCRGLRPQAEPVTAGHAKQSTGIGSGVSAKSAKDAEAGTIMIDVLVGLLIGTIGIGVVLGAIALTTWRASYARQDTLQIIQTRNERAKNTIFEINADTFKDDKDKLDVQALRAILESEGQPPHKSAPHHD